MVFQGRHFYIFVSYSSLFTETWSSLLFQIALSSHLQRFMVQIFFFFFPLNFLVLISVFYDFDCLLRLRVSPRQPWSQPLRARRTGGRARFLRTACLHLDMHHRRRKSGRWTLMSCGRTSCGECVVAGRWGVGRKENQVLTTYLTDQVLFQLFTEISVVLKCFPA